MIKTKKEQNNKDSIEKERLIMKKKLLVSLAAAAILALSVTACGTSPSQSSTSGTTVTQSGTTSTSGQNTLSASAIVTPDVPSQTSSTQTGETTGITEEEAKQIALDHAQVQEADLTYLNVKKDYDDGISVYEVDFGVGGKEYEYDIKADDGQILKTDYEIDKDYVDPNTQTAVSEADARASALARVEGASDSDIRIKLDRDDGRLIYEGKIIYNNTEYEFEISADTGEFLKWEQDSVYD